MAKRVRASECDWAVTFVDSSSLSTIVKCINSVLTQVTIKVGKSGDGRHFLTVDGADQGYTCCVSARLQLDQVTMPEDEEEFSFCVECKHLLIALDSSTAGHGSLILEGHGNLVRIKMFDPDQHSFEDSSEINTVIEQHEGNGTLNTMNFDMMVEIEISKFREFIRKVSKTHCELLRLQIYMKEMSGKQQSLVIFSAHGDCTHHQKFRHTVTKDADGSVVVRAVADSTDDLFEVGSAQEIFNHAFPVDKIDSFLKPLTCRMLLAKVHKGMPLMLNHTFGNSEDSWIRFLVAPRNEDDF